MCTHPLKGFVVGTTSNGKPEYKICSYSTDHVELIGNSLVPTDSLRTGNYFRKVYREFIEIPCGKCIECRLAYSRQWADRMMLEAQEHETSYFLTLTYDEMHVPYNALGYQTLCKDDFQRFMKRLRRAVEPDIIRFFACGEYGDNTHRPHYHAIVFGLKIDDLMQFGFSGDYPVYISKKIASIWKNGHVMIAPISWDTCAYTARYVVKKQKGFGADFYKELDLVPEFCLMSRRPGIARKYFDEHYKEIYKTDELIFSTEKGGRVGKPPKYFDKCLELIDERWYTMVKESRQRVSAAARETLLFTNHCTIEEILERREKATLSRIKALKRIL